jgi:chromosome segregation ATPase
MTAPLDTTKIAATIEKVKSLQDQHAKAERETSAARSTETRLLNALNEAQKELDTMLAALRASAPRESDWKRKDREAEARRCAL